MTGRLPSLLTSTWSPYLTLSGTRSRDYSKHMLSHFMKLWTATKNKSGIALTTNPHMLTSWVLYTEALNQSTCSYFTLQAMETSWPKPWRKLTFWWTIWLLQTTTITLTMTNLHIHHSLILSSLSSSKPWWVNFPNSCPKTQQRVVYVCEDADIVNAEVYKDYDADGSIEQHVDVNYIGGQGNFQNRGFNQNFRNHPNLSYMNPNVENP